VCYWLCNHTLLFVKSVTPLPLYGSGAHDVNKDKFYPWLEHDYSGYREPKIPAI
jgi:hypothetical protein